jgi:hypothetical protein
MTKAVLRPDYLTGAEVAEKLGGLASTIGAAQHGILLFDTTRLEALVGADCIVCDDSVPWRDLHADWRPDGGGDPGSEPAPREFVFLSQGALVGARPRGFGTVHSGFSAAARRAFIAQRQEFGKSVVYVGDCNGQAAIAAQADFAVNVLEMPFPTVFGTRPAILGAHLSKIERLIALAEVMVKERRTARSIILLPNMAAVLGALFLNTSAAASVFLTNLGSFAAYARYGTLLAGADLYRTAIRPGGAHFR